MTTVEVGGSTLTWSERVVPSGLTTKARAEAARGWELRDGTGYVWAFVNRSHKGEWQWTVGKSPITVGSAASLEQAQHVCVEVIRARIPTKGAKRER